MELTTYHIRAAINRAEQKLERQKQAVAATEAEIQLWRSQQDGDTLGAGAPKPPKRS